MGQLVADLVQRWLPRTGKTPDNRSSGLLNERDLCIGETVIASHEPQQFGELYLFGRLFARDGCCDPSLLDDATLICQREFEGRPSNELAGFDEVSINPRQQMQLHGASEFPSHDVRNRGMKIELEEEVSPIAVGREIYLAARVADNRPRYPSRTGARFCSGTDVRKGIFGNGHRAILAIASKMAPRLKREPAILSGLEGAVEVNEADHERHGIGG